MSDLNERLLQSRLEMLETVVKRGDGEAAVNAVELIRNLDRDLGDRLLADLIAGGVDRLRDTLGQVTA